MSTKKARFDMRITMEQKEFYEHAASLAGFRSLTDFVMIALQDKAKAIIAEHQQFLASVKDQEIFFNALLTPAAPNQALVAAAKSFKDATK